MELQYKNLIVLKQKQQIRMSFGSNIQERRSIFGKQKLKKFDSIYQTILPDFIQKLDQCQCLHAIKPCQKVLSLFSTQFLSQAELLYENIKAEAKVEQSNEPLSTQRLSFCEKILQPHLSNLTVVIQTSRMEPLYQILRHAKCEYLSFWTYAALCDVWPSYSEFKRRILKFGEKQKLDLGERLYDFETKLLELHSCKFGNIFNENYMMVVKWILQKEYVIEKIAAIILIRGRQRKEHQILKASIQYQ